MPAPKALEAETFKLKKPRSKAVKIDSVILRDPKVSSTEEQLELIVSALNNPKELKLLFRASEHAFSAVAFHEKCDQARKTLTIIRT